MDEALLIEEEGGVVTLTINRPEKANALDSVSLKSIGDFFAELTKQRRMKVVVIRGAGSKSFCSGFDVGKLRGDRPAGGLSNIEAVRHGMNSLAKYPYPVIAMIHGQATGLGLELAVTCDIRLADDASSFGIPAARLGLVYHESGIRKLVDLVGVGATKELLYTGRSIDARKAEAIGLVHQMIPAEQLHSATYRLATDISKNAPLSLRSTKITIAKLTARGSLSPEAEAELDELCRQSLTSNDLKEGQRAFLEGREPKFTGS